LKPAKDEDEAHEDTIMTKEQEDNLYNLKIKEALKLAFDGIGISAKATTDDLISLAENEDGDQGASGATHRRKGLKLPAIYGSKQYEEHLYMGMVEINQLEDDDEMPDLLGDDYNKPPEGFDDPFANDADPFGNNDFNPPGDPLFSDSAAYAPPSAPGGAPPPPAPPSSGGAPPPPMPPSQSRAPSTDHLPPHLQQIAALKSRVDAENKPIGDPSERGSFLQDPGDYAQPGQQMLHPPGGGRGQDPNASYDPYAEDDSIFVGSKAITQQYKGNAGNNIFEQSMVDGKNIFNDTMNDMSMSMDQDVSKNNISRLFNTDNRQPSGDLNPAGKKKGGAPAGIFDKIDEDDEEDKYEDHGNKPKGPPGLFSDMDSPTKGPTKTPGAAFLDETMNEEESYEKFNAKPQPPQQSKNMFDDTFDEGDSVLFPPKTTPAQNKGNALPGLAKPSQKPAAAFNYGQPEPPQQPQKSKNMLFADESFQEEDSNIFPTKKAPTGGMFSDDMDDSIMNQSMTSERDKSFIDKQKESNSKNHAMAMIMQGMNKKKVAKESEISIGDEGPAFDEPEPPKQAPAQAKAPRDYQPPATKPKANPMFLDESQSEIDESMTMNLPTKNPTPTPAKQPAKKNMFMDDDEDGDESFIFSKPKANPVAPTSSNPPVANEPPAQKKAFMFDDADESFDGFNMPAKAVPANLLEDESAPMNPGPPETIKPTPEPPKPVQVKCKPIFCDF